MKNKKIIIILTSLVVLIGGIFLVNNIYQSRNKINKTKRKKQNNLAIIIKDENGVETTSKEIPKGLCVDHIFNDIIILLSLLFCRSF